MSRSYWTEQEDKKLTKLFEKYGTKWDKIQKHFPDRTVSALSRRWSRIDPSFFSGKWNTDEDAKLIEFMVQSTINSIDMFNNEEKPRRKHDLMKRIERYGKMLGSNL